MHRSDPLSWDDVIYVRREYMGIQRYQCYFFAFLLRTLVRDDVNCSWKQAHPLCANNLLPSFWLEVFLARAEELTVILAHKVVPKGVCSYVQDIVWVFRARVALLEQPLARDIDSADFLPRDLMDIGIFIQGPV